MSHAIRPVSGWVERRVDGKKQQVSVVGWRIPLVREHLLSNHADGSWCDPVCLARTFYRGAYEGNQKKARSNVRGFRSWCLKHDELVLVDYDTGDHGKVKAIKFFTPTTATDLDRQIAAGMIARAEELRDLKAEEAAKARQIVGL